MQRVGTVAAVPPLLFGLRLWASVCLALYVAFWLELDNAYWAGTTAAIVCQPHLGASLRKGWFRMIGTVVGAVAIVVMTACFPQNRAAFFVTLALWGAGCALVATLLRNFAAYAAALAGYTAAIIASDQLGATGGLNGQAFMLAVTRASEICIGIVCAGIVLAGTDLGGARRRLATFFGAITAEISGRFIDTLATAGAEFERTQTVRRELVRRVIALDPAIDEAFGEFSQLRYHSPVLQNGRWTVCCRPWPPGGRWQFCSRDCRSSGRRKRRLPRVAAIPEELRFEAEQDEPARWIGNPTRLLRVCDAAVRRLVVLPAGTPSLRLLADQTAEVAGGISHALNGLALLVADPARAVSRSRGHRAPPHRRLASPLVNAARAFVVIGAAELFWIVTAWPSGAEAITFAAIGVILFAPRADQAYAMAIGFMIGSIANGGYCRNHQIRCAAGNAEESFAAFALAIGLVFVPAGAWIALPWQTGDVYRNGGNISCRFWRPRTRMTYDTTQFYNAALAIVAGDRCCGAFRFA